MNAVSVDKSQQRWGLEPAAEANSLTDYHYYCEYEMLGINKKDCFAVTKIVSIVC